MQVISVIVHVVLARGESLHAVQVVNSIKLVKLCYLGALVVTSVHTLLVIVNLLTPFIDEGVPGFHFL